MKKLISIIIIISLTTLNLTGCTVSFSFKIKDLKSIINVDKMKAAGEVESVEDLKNLKDKKYDNLYNDIYNDENILLSQDDDYFITLTQYSPIKSRIGLNFKYFRGYQTKAYFYRYKQTTDHITFNYKGVFKSGKCKLIIISPSLKIVSSIDLNGQASTDVPITEDGTYYVRLVGDDAVGGDIEFDAKGNDIVYKFTPDSYKDKNTTGLYDYE
ncbi:hypothetical protein NNC19_06160 [Clostridium sp. SHJSY1]|uniref:hypothetical protein n=1 Tax=Clostridium sp. SHJSY1 TaxID=2942483 RepID=UPI002874D88F|nr:hypothetical protein [Clostridium sp. SHJSY1]MDS0525258.1 hypothetical protein [Clostridium sp. SHJSY1]